MTKNLTKVMTGVVLAASVALAVPVQSFAAAVTGTRADLQATRDANGYPIVLESDRAWKVFEVATAGSQVQVTDEDGKTPTKGVLHKVCLESAAAFPADGDWVKVWDSSAATGASDAGYRILPPVMRASRAEKCTDALNAIFTRGLRASAAMTGGAYLYWRELGAKR